VISIGDGYVLAATAWVGPPVVMEQERTLSVVAEAAELASLSGGEFVR
jgi:hypothetical protein